MVAEPRGRAAEGQRLLGAGLGARGLLHCYRPSAAGQVLAALGDDQWRVREMAAKGVVGEGEHAEAVREVADDHEEAVRTAAETSLRWMRKRPDRDV